MPAEHAGAAAVFLALRLADEFHGSVVNGYEVLERAGFLKKTELASGETRLQEPGSTSLAEALEVVARIIDETGKEFDRLPVFVRPIARAGFKSKSGMSGEDWKRALAAAREGRVHSGLGASLEKLGGYYEAVPGETARFTRDKDLLAEVAKTCDDRIAAIRRLKSLV
jgi:hypothetical protein